MKDISSGIGIEVSTKYGEKLEEVKEASENNLKTYITEMTRLTTAVTPFVCGNVSFSTFAYAQINFFLS